MQISAKCDANTQGKMLTLFATFYNYLDTYGDSEKNAAISWRASLMFNCLYVNSNPKTVKAMANQISTTPQKGPTYFDSDKTECLE